MIFVYGGVYQGKLEYVKENYEFRSIFNCKTDDLDLLFSSNVIINLEYIVKRLLEERIYPKDYIISNLENFKDKIIVGNEIGLGVVPVDKFERLWRDETGFLYQQIARNANEVIRLWNGIPSVIKKV